MTWPRTSPSFRLFGTKQLASQRAAIDRIDPLLRDIAASLTATIKYLNHNNHNQSEMKDPVFRSRVAADRLKIDTVYRAICECPKG